jgi:hypothetical protein
MRTELGMIPIAWVLPENMHGSSDATTHEEYIGKSCVRFKRVSDLDEEVLRELIRATASASACS